MGAAAAAAAAAATIERLDYIRGMSSGAKRFVQSLRGRASGPNSNSKNDSTGGGASGPSTSATRLCHYDSGHELDEISVVGGTPMTPCHCPGVRYGSGQTLYSIAASVPPAPGSIGHSLAMGTIRSNASAG